MGVDWKQAKAIFGDLIELPANRRRDALHGRVGDDQGMHEVVQRLLDAHHTATEFLCDRTEPETDESSEPEQAPERIGPYQIHEILGEGGFGIVYRASQTAPITREVALKILKRGMDTQRVVRRFQAERDVLARMAHPGIATVLDAGVTEDGRPFVVMELVRGIPITEYCHALELPVSKRVALLGRVARAIHHAHQRAVIHRDLKPSNILVEEIDGEPLPRIIDFGIAKVISDSRRDGESQPQEIIGTPRYMSPEQMDRSVPADTRVDVYSLGVVLCEVLTGAVPRDPKTMLAKPLRETTAERPSRLARQKTGDPDDTRSAPETTRQLKGDLDRIVLKCVEWEPDRRYDSAAALADDLDRFLSGAPVLAVEPSFGYRLRKFVRRHQVSSAFAAVAFLSLALGMTAAIIGQRRAETALQTAEDARKLADQQAARAEFVSSFLLDEMLEASDPDTARAIDEPVTVEQLLRNAENYARTSLADDRQSLFEILGRIGSAYVRIRRSDLAMLPLQEAISIGQQLEGSAAQVLDLRITLAEAREERREPAEEIARTRQEIRERAIGLFGPDHPVSIRARSAALTGAAPQKVVDEVQSMLASNPPDPELRRQLFELLADALRALRRFDEELAAREEAVAVTNSMYQHGHSAAFSAQYQLARTYATVERYGDAAAIFEEMFRASESVIPLNHLGRLSSASMAIRMNLELDQADHALAIAVDAERLAREQHGMGSFDHGLTAQLIAQVLLARGDNELADEAIRVSTQVREELLADNADGVPDLLAVMALLLLEVEQPQTTLILAEEAMNLAGAADYAYAAGALARARAFKALGRDDRLPAFIDRVTGRIRNANGAMEFVPQLEALLDDQELPRTPTEVPASESLWEVD